MTVRDSPPKVFCFFSSEKKAFLLWLLAAAPAHGQVSLHPPIPDFGIRVGDLLTATAVVRVPTGEVLDRRTLPVVGPVAAGVDVRGVRVRAAGGAVEVAVTYQSFVSPEQVSRADVPGYGLVFVAAGRRVAVAVPGFGFSAAPFRHDLQPVIDVAAWRGDHALAPADVGWAWWMAGGGGLVAAGCAGVLLADRARGVAAGGRPFAAVARAMRGGGAGADGFRLLHRAFDATAGRAVLAGDVAGFVAEHRRFAGLGGEIAAFFAASQRVFFGDAGAGGEIDVRGLARALARVERG